jgi:deoxyribodipyrimidine photo-lyase
MQDSVDGKPPSAGTVIVWFRHDLRLADNPALTAAVASGRPVLAAFVLDDETPDIRSLGGAARWWLHGSLAALSASVRQRGAALHLFKGKSASVIAALVKAAGASAVYWNRRYGEAERSLDGAIKDHLKTAGIEARSFNSHLLREPWEVQSKAGTPMKVFTPYWRAARERGEPAAPLPAPQTIRSAVLPVDAAIRPVSLDGLALKPTKPDWAAEMATLWTPGEDGARDNLNRFLESAIDGYGENRNRLHICASARSAHARSGRPRGWLPKPETAPENPTTSTSSWQKWAGGSSPIICSTSFRSSPAPISSRASMPSHGSATRKA